MQADYYSNNVDFYAKFEADTFDEEEREGLVFKGYVYVDGERKLAAEFTHDADDEFEGGGFGWWDSTLV